MRAFAIYVLLSFFATPLTHASPDIETPWEDRPSLSNVSEMRQKIKKKFSNLPIGARSYSREQILEKYDHLDPMNLVPNDLLENAVLYFDQHKEAFENRDYISVVNYSQVSNEPRFYVIDLLTGEVWAIRTAHGKGGDRNHDGFVESVGNVSGSKKSSKGFFQVSEIYSGKFGRSVRLDGLSDTNSRVRARAIVIHGSDYVKETDKKQSRSWGCFALAWSVKDELVTLLHGGSLLYADYSSPKDVDL
ncbi:MAG: murein L,D-transpeptidase catalytic domain-containing protein [Pseudomonadota bacterium]